MKNLIELYGKKAVVTGATSGMGKVFALELTKQGIEVYLVARNQSRLGETVQEIKSKYKVNAHALSVDLSDQNAVISFIQTIDNEDIGMLIHSAGLENNGAFEKISDDKEMAVVNVNVMSTYLLTKHFSQKMSERGKGGILLLSSLIRLMPSPYFTNYAAQKLMYTHWEHR